MLPLKEKRITLSAMAKALNLAPVTVSVCLSGKAEAYKIKPATVELVRDYAQKIGYIPNSAARKLRIPESSPVGLIFDHQVRAGETTFGAINMAVELLAAHGMDAKLQAVTARGIDFAALRAAGCRDVIVFAKFTESGTDPESYRKFVSDTMGMRIFAVNFCFPNRGGARIFPGVYRYGINRSAVGKLLAKFFGNARLDNILFESSDNFRILLDEKRIAPEQILRNDGEFENQPYLLGRSHVDHYWRLRSRRRIDYAFMSDDRIAAGFIAEALKRGVRIPDDLQVLSFDNLEFGEFLAVPLSSWGIPLKLHTRLALSAIIDGAKIPAEVVSVPDFSWRATMDLAPVRQTELRALLAKEFVTETVLKTYFTPKETV